MDLRPAVAKLRMIEVSRVVGSYLRTAWENDVYRAYFDGHESGSRYAWSKAGKEGEPPGCEAEEDLREENADPQMDEDLKKLEASLGSPEARKPGSPKARKPGCPDRGAPDGPGA